MTTRHDVDLALSSLVDQLKRGLSARQAAPALKELLKRDPNNAAVHYNLGLVLSNLGELPEAIIHLKRAAKHDPDNYNALTGQGTAYARMKKWTKALEVLEQAIAMAPDDPYVKRSMGSVLAQLNQSERALELLREAFTALPDDEIAHQSLAFALLETVPKQSDEEERRKLETEADELLQSFLRRYPDSVSAQEAERARSHIAEQTMRRKVGGGLRPDVVMYITGALKKFDDLGPEATKKLTLEVALKGREGLNINDPNTTYTLESLPGEFTGLHLLAIMYAGLKQLDPALDAGVDFSAEYAQAKLLHGAH